MSAPPAEIDIVANDDASSVFQEVSSNFGTMQTTISTDSSTMASDVTEDSQQAASSVSSMTTSVTQSSTGVSSSLNQTATANASLTGAQQTSNVSTLQTVGAFGQVASAGASAVLQVSNLENAHTTLERAQLVQAKAANDVTLAQQNYNQEVAKYGANSIQATDAASKLSLAQQTLSVDNDRVTEAQRNLNNDMLMAGVSVIPSITSAVT